MIVVHLINTANEIVEAFNLFADISKQVFGATAIDVLGIDQHHLTIDRRHLRQALLNLQFCFLHA